VPVKHNRTILISEHAIDRFIQRFDFAGKTGQISHIRIAAEQAIQEVWHQASYISDDAEGVLFRNRDFQCDFIVKDKVIKTLFQTKLPGGQPENHSAQDIIMQNNNSRFRQSNKKRSHRARR
jgi:hypothetical protein